MKILIIEDNHADFILIYRHLHQHGIDAECLPVTTQVDLEIALAESWDLVLSDYNVPGMAFRSALHYIQLHQPELPVILVSGSVGEETAVELLRLGMNDFVLKNSLIRLVPAIHRALNERYERQARKEAEQALLNAQAKALEAEYQARQAALKLMEEAIAARARAEASNAALRESEQRLLLAQEGAHVGIWEWDLLTNLCYWSPECLSIYGIDENRAFQSNDDWLQRVHPDDRAKIDALWDSHIKHGKEFEVEYRFVQDSGAIRWLISKGRSQLNAGGEPVKLSGINLDITDRKKTEEQLRKLALAVEQSPESIIITNLSGEIEYVNMAYKQASGYDRDELIGANPHILRSEKTPIQVYEQLWTTLLQGETWVGELVNRRKDGNEYIVLCSINPIRDINGGITHYLAIQQDVTEKKRIDEELNMHRFHLEQIVESRTRELQAATMAADAANQAKSAFLANMSHEIRTPMNAIIGLTYLLKQSQLNSQQLDRLDKIETASQHLLAIINDILDISKIDAGHVQLEETDFTLDSVLHHVNLLISAQAKSKNLQVDVECAETLQWLRGDRTRLRQALLNYASNAVKFTERGQIRLVARLLNSDGKNVHLRFEVHDTGIGLDEGVLPMLFSPFTQADVSTTRKYGGTGLGLAITRRLAELFGGEVGAESVLGRGSCFWFTVLLQVGQSRYDTIKQTSAIKLSEYPGVRILLVEDSTINRNVFQELLQKLGYEVDVAENGQVAVEKVIANRYELVLMDIQMPKMDGIEATRILRTQHGFKNLPILAMTANVFDDDRSRCLAVGMNDFVPKPIDPETLKATLQKWLSPYALSAPEIPVENFIDKQEDMPEPSVLAFLETVGLEFTKGLLLVNGNVIMYRRLLNMFAEIHANDMKKVLAKLAEADIKSIKEILHSLKGVASTLGATRIANRADKLERIVSTNIDMEVFRVLSEDCDRELTQLVNAILHLADLA